MGSSYPSSLSPKKNLRIKHVRRANWMAPTCPQRMFLVFTKGWGGLNSHQVPIVPIKLPNSTHQIPLVPINNPSKSFCSHQVFIVPINFLLFSAQPYINPHKALTFCINFFFFCNLETWLLRWFHSEKDERNVIYKKKKIEKM